MPDIDENLSVWTGNWNWAQRGDEWSAWWGDTDAMWHGAVMPRVHAFVPTGSILEVAPGYGRWTQYLKDLCQRLTVVDLAPNCIEHCRQRFADARNIAYHVNDGRSLSMIADESVDLVFSMDSLVHAEADVLESYLSQLATKLTPDGVGFIHHSNAGAYGRSIALARRTPYRVLRPLARRGVLIDLFAWRAESVDADAVAAMCGRAGLVCVAQEKISWESGYHLIDTFTTFTRPGSRWERPRAVTRNPLFRREARRAARLYARASFPNGG